MSFYCLKRVQVLPVSLATAWEYFSSPKNLAKITPAYMKFKITSEFHFEKMYAGQIIAYTVSPLFNIPLNWMTEITHVKLHEYFIDEQRIGPYVLWHHQHHFIEVPGGVEMTDIVNYKIPLGLLGGIAHKLFIRKQLEEIFDFRFNALEKLFGTESKVKS